MKFTTVLAFLIVFAAGLGVGWFSNPPTTQDLEKTTTESVDGIKTQVESMTAAEFAEYEKLKTLEEKYKKADEILGKIVAIFIADIGMRINKPTITIPPAETVPTPAPIATTASAANMNSVPVTSIGGTTEAAKKMNSWVASEKSIQDIRNEHDANDFLKQAAIVDLTEALKSTGRFTNTSGLLDELSGVYTGRANVKLKDRDRVWEVEMRLNGRMESGSLKGRASIQMTENGKRFSNSRDSGDLKSFREFTNGSTAILVGAAPGTYFQLYYMQGMGSLMGNVYEQVDDTGPYNHIGTISLRK